MDVSVYDTVEDGCACNHLLYPAVRCNDLVWSILHTVCQVQCLFEVRFKSTLRLQRNVLHAMIIKLLLV